MATTKKFSGPEKAAILLMSIGEEFAAAILAELDQREIQVVGNYMSALGDVNLTAMDVVNKEFVDTVESGGGGLGISGVDFLKNALLKVLDPQKTNEILSNISAPGEDMGGGLDTLRMLEPRAIAGFLASEHPQTAAIILAHLEHTTASLVIRELPEDIRMEAIHRLATLERVSPTVVRQLDEALSEEFRSRGAISGSKLGGIDSAAKIMGGLDRTTESNILTAMDETDPDLANEIRNLRFTFEDMLKIDDQGMQLVLKEVNQEELLVGLKTASDDLKEKIFANMSQRASAMLKEDLDSLGPTRVSDVEKSQQKIVSICKRLEEEAKIVIGGSGEQLV